MLLFFLWLRSLVCFHSFFTILHNTYGVNNLKKLLFITWSVSYGYGTEKSLADVLNRIYKACTDC